MSIGEQAVQIARSKLGMHEEGGENTGPIVEWAMKPWTNAQLGSWAKWCAAFVSTCLLEAGSQTIRKVASTSCDTLWNRCEKAGYAWRNYNTPTQRKPAVGDIIFYGTSKDLYHVGIVSGIDNNYVTLIEGNDHDAVHESKHLLTQTSIFGFARIP